MKFLYPHKFYLSVWLLTQLFGCMFKERLHNLFLVILLARGTGQRLP